MNNEIPSEEELQKHPYYYLALFFAGVNGGYADVHTYLGGVGKFMKSIDAVLDYGTLDATPENLALANQTVRDHLDMFKRLGGGDCLGLAFSGDDAEQDQLMATDPGAVLLEKWMED